MNWLPPTILVSLLACIACVIVRPGLALGIIVASALIWPEYLRIPMGAQMSAPRLAALVLLARMIMVPGPVAPRWRVADTMVLLLYLWIVLANVLQGTRSEALITLIGSGFDTLVMYQVARRVFANAKEAPYIAHGLIASAVVLAPIALFENLTKWSPYLSYLFAQTGKNLFSGGGSEVRLGMYRAFSSTQVPIYFGMAMMIVSGLIFSFRNCFQSRWVAWAGLMASLACVFSSLSSGPWLGVIFVAVINAFYWQRRLITPTLWAIFGAMCLMEGLSNRHFYHLIDRISMGSDNAYYRTRLVEVAVSHLDEFWLFGAGGSPLGHWGEEIDGRTMVDMVNNYLILACNGGVLALLIYLAAKVCVVTCLVRSFRRGSPLMKPIAFGLGALVLGVSLAEMSVGLFGPALLFSYMVMGCAVSTAEWGDQWARQLRARNVDRPGNLRERPARENAPHANIYGAP